MDIYKEISEVRPGSLLKEDIFANTKNPIIAKDTKLQLEHFEVLRAFEITRVLIESKAQGKTEQTALDEGTAITLTPEVEQLLNDSKPAKSETLEMLYGEAVAAYRKELLNYRAGKRLDVAAVRAITLPVIQAFLEQKDYVRRLNDFSFSAMESYRSHHSIKVGILAALMSDRMGYPAGQVLQIGVAGVLADVGMAKIDPKIIDKVAFLSIEEMNEVKKHVIHSFQMVQDSSLIRQEMKIAILQHHERIDGSGYPRSLSGESITEISQIISVADVYQAMVSERPYRQKENPFKVIESMKEEEFGKFSPHVLNVLQNLVGKLSIGMKVKLTTNEIAEILYIHQNTPLRPLVKVLSTGNQIDLLGERQITIEKVY